MNMLRVMKKANYIFMPFILAYPLVSSANTPSDNLNAPNNNLFEYIDNPKLNADKNLSNCKKSLSSIDILASSITQTNIWKCDYTSQYSWPGTESDYVRKGEEIWHHKVYISSPKSITQDSGIQDYNYLALEGGDAADDSVDLLKGMILSAAKDNASNILAPSDASQLNNIINQFFIDNSSIDNGVYASLIAWLSAKPVVVQDGAPIEPMDMKSIVDNQTYYHRNREDLMAESIMYPYKKGIQSDINALTFFPAAASIVHTMSAFKNTTLPKDMPKPNRFLLAGASKVAWMSYLATAYDAEHDKMIKALVPLVMPIDLPSVLSTIYTNYGKFPYNIDKNFNDDEAFHTGRRDILTNIVKGDKDILAIESEVDFSTYLKNYNYLHFPIFEIAASGDDYFTPDSEKPTMDDLWYYDRNATFMVVPNVGHGRLTVAQLPTLLNYAKQLVSYISSDSQHSLVARFRLNDSKVYIETNVPEKIESISYTCAFVKARDELIDQNTQDYGKDDNKISVADFKTTVDGLYTSSSSYQDISKQITNCGGTKPPTGGLKAFDLIMRFKKSANQSVQIKRTSPIYIETLN